MITMGVGGLKDSILSGVCKLVDGCVGSIACSSTIVGYLQGTSESLAAAVVVCVHC